MRLCLASPKRGIPWAPKALFGPGRQAQSPKPPPPPNAARPLSSLDDRTHKWPSPWRGSIFSGCLLMGPHQVSAMCMRTHWVLLECPAYGFITPSCTPLALSSRTEKPWYSSIDVPQRRAVPGFGMCHVLCTLDVLLNADDNADDTGLFGLLGTPFHGPTIPTYTVSHAFCVRVWGVRLVPGSYVTEVPTRTGCHCPFTRRRMWR